MKKAYLIISIIINIILLPIACGGIFVYMDDPMDYPLSLALSVAFIPLSFLVISVISLLKDMAWHKTVLLKVTAFIFAFGLSFISFDEGYYAAILFEFAALAFLFLTIGIFRIDRKTSLPTQTKRQLPYCYAGEFVFDDAADEYMKMSGINSRQDLTDDDFGQIYRYSMMPVAYYFYWLLRKGFMSDKFWELTELDISETDLENHNVDVLGLFEAMYWQLDSFNMLKGAGDFSKHYAELNYAGLYSDKLIFDYYDEIKNSEGFFYCVDFSWDVCERMYDRIDKAYEKWSALFDHSTEYYEDESEYETKAKVIYSKRFGRELDVYRSGDKIRNNITDEYISRCIADLDSMDEYQFERLDRNISDDYGDSLKGKVMEEFHSYSVYVFEPQNDGDLVYIVSGGADFEEEHGIAFYVRSGVIFSYGYGYQFDDIYSPENIRNYEIAANEIEFEKISDMSQADELANEGKLIKTYLIPLGSGGKADESNMVYLTPHAVKEKELLDSRLQALEALWHGKLKYKYTAVYYDDKKQFIPKDIYVRHDAAPSACEFGFYLKVWY